MAELIIAMLKESGNINNIFKIQINVKLKVFCKRRVNFFLDSIELINFQLVAPQLRR